MNTTLSVIKDPFIAEAVGNIVIGRVKAATPYWFAIVYFEAGHTTGQQRTPNCSNFDEVCMALKTILDAVKNK